MSFNQLLIDQPDPQIARSGTLVPPDTVIPDDAVLVGRPPHVIRSATDADRERLAVLRQHQTNLTDHPGTIVRGPTRAGARMGTLYAYRDKIPTIGAGTLLFDSAEITGDVVIGEDSACRSSKTPCCTYCPTTNSSSATTWSSAPAR